MNFTKQDLTNGKTIVFQTKDKEDLREADLSFSGNLNKFVIWFNGKLIHTSKTFKSLENRFNKLKSKWDLEFNRVEDESI